MLSKKSGAICATLAMGLVFQAAIVEAKTKSTPTPKPANKAKTKAKTPAKEESKTEPWEITVTGTRTPRLKDTTPGEIGVATKDQLSLRQARRLSDFLDEIPGVYVTDGPRAVGQRVNIRGLDGARIQTSVDGMKFNFQSGHKGSSYFDPGWLSRVEVIKGPSSSLDGSGGLGGAVHLFTIDPAELLAESPKGGYETTVGFQGSDSGTEFRQTLFGKASDKHPWLVSWTSQKANDVQMGGNPNTKLPFSGDNQSNFLGKFILKASKTNTFSFNGLRYENDAIAPLNLNTNTTTASALGKRRTDQQGLRLAWEHSNPKTPGNLWKVAVYKAAMDMREIRLSDKRLETIAFDTEAVDVSRQRMGNLFGAPTRWLMGLEAYTDDQSGRRNTGANFFFPKGTQTHQAAFVQAEIAAAKTRVQIIPGLRYESYRHSSTGQPDGQDTHMSPRLGLTWAMSTKRDKKGPLGLILSAQYAEGFRAPLFQELYISGLHFPGFAAGVLGPGSAASPAGWFFANPNLKSEIGKTNDVGFRYRSGRFKAATSFFQTDAEDFIDVEFPAGPALPQALIVGCPPAPPCPGAPTQTLYFKAVQVSKARLSGFEGSLSYKLDEYGELYVQRQTVRGANKVNGQPLGSVAPPETMVAYRFSDPKRHSKAAVRYRMVEGQDRVPAGGVKSRAFALLDVAIDWHPTPAWKLQVGIDNFTNERYTPYLAGIPMPGRNPKFQVSHTIRF